MASRSTPSRNRLHENPFESGIDMLGNIGKVVGSEVTNQASEFGKGFLAQLLNIDSSRKTSQAESNMIEPQLSVAAKSNEVFDSKKFTNTIDHAGSNPKRKYRFESQHADNVPVVDKPHKKESRAAIEYHEQFTREVMEFDRKSSQHEINEMGQQIQEILQELKKLINSSDSLRMQFVDIAVSEQPVVVGKYHVNFFEWVLIVIKQAKQKVDDASAWLSTVKGKNGKKSGYWDMFKKHGTSFAMSNERAVATQVG